MPEGMSVIEDRPESAFLLVRRNDSGLGRGRTLKDGLQEFRGDPCAVERSLQPSSNPNNSGSPRIPYLMTSAIPARNSRAGRVVSVRGSISTSLG